MPTPPLDAAKQAEIRRLRAQGKSVKSIARHVGVSYHTAAKYTTAPTKEDEMEVAPLVAELLAGRVLNHESTPETQVNPKKSEGKFDNILLSLRKTPMSLEDIAAKAETSSDSALAWLIAQRDAGANLHEFGGRWSVEKEIRPAHTIGTVHEYRSRPDGTYLFGAAGDQHMGSRYERLDVSERLYDRFADEGVDRVFNTGNWIDGESVKTRFDVAIHGMDAQLSHLARNFPRRDGIVTYAVAGDDHEGWYAQREGVDIGRKALHSFADEGRSDWVDLGYMEAHVRLVNAQTGKVGILAVVHPGGGSAYALSYSIQKIVESYDGGEKPAVGLYGHYHKLWSGNIRNVHTVQTGCAQDQTPFMRKRRLEAHVGGYLVKLKQDPESGAIVEMTTTMLRYFNRGFYNDRWSHAHSVVLPERT